MDQFLLSPPTGRDAATYKITTGVRARAPLGSAACSPGCPAFALHDLRVHALRRAVSADHVTFMGFTAPNNTHDWSRIDFIFGGANGGRVGSTLMDDGVLASDHRLVFADVRI
ncbi:hypothetical protein DFH07DRAFT_968372 [Mycena maculata]|uniref:Endonuclease/exonuclease/phosphatase n=1 Tax=Mycena maculata TaxID=230809 RepID=A0AAD7I2F9_9AGAR|nr:hypothetical protein DFH07DRAFT_968372 [Mycena maculata]